MTFSARVKKELCARVMDKPCCARAFCFGAAAFARTFTAEQLVFRTESEDVLRCLKTAFAAQGIPLDAGRHRVHGHEKLALSTQVAENAPLAALAAMDVQTALRCPACVGAYLTGAFLAGGVISNPEKEYHLEFVGSRDAALEDVAVLLQAQGFTARRSRRKDSGVVYLRASEQIEDILTLMGAGRFAMEIMNAKIYKTYRNQANRVTNCETANIDKTVTASQQAMAAIRFLRDSGALQALPEPLQAAAKARLDAPDATLAELAAAMQPPVSKSGLAHRMKKLMDTARRLGAADAATPSAADNAEK